MHRSPVGYTQCDQKLRYGFFFKLDQNQFDQLDQNQCDQGGKPCIQCKFKIGKGVK